MAKNIYLFLFFVLPALSYCQEEDLDVIFGNEAVKPSIYVGTNIMACLAGVPNIVSDLRLRESKYFIQAGAGIMPFNYRLRLESTPFGVFNFDKGKMFQIGGAMRILKVGIWGEGGIYVGPKIEVLQCRYYDYAQIINFEGFEENNGFGPGFELNGPDAILYTNRFEQNYGLLIHYLGDFGRKWSFVGGVSVGRNYTRIRYDKENSIGVTWKVPEPTGWKRHYFDSHHRYLRVNIGVRFKVF